MSRRHAPTTAMRTWEEIPRTETIRRALDSTRDHTASDDFLFLEAWEMRATPDVAAALRAQQIRRANPLLAAELRAEVKHGRPLTAQERGALAGRFR